MNDYQNSSQKYAGGVTTTMFGLVVDFSSFTPNVSINARFSLEKEFRYNCIHFRPEKARDISSTLLDAGDAASRSRGADMFARRREKADSWVHEPRREELAGEWS